MNQLTEQQIRDLSARLERCTRHLEECAQVLPHFQYELGRYTDHVEKTKACIVRNEEDIKGIFKMLRGQEPYRAEEK